MLIVDLDFVVSQSKNPYLISYEERDRRVEAFKEFTFHKAVPPIFFVPSNEAFAILHPAYGRGEASDIEHLTHIGFYNTPSIGKQIDIVGNTIFTDFLKKYAELFLYQSFLGRIEGTAIAKIPHTGKTIGCYNSNVIFLPQLAEPVSNETEFLQDLYEVAKKIRQPTIEAELPTWANAYFLPEEQQIVQKKKELEAQIIALQNEVQQKQVAIREKEKYKTLFTETGKPLEQAVLKLFQDLVLDVQEGRDKLEDGVLRFAGQTAVWEVKGLTGSASLKDSRQLVSWAQDYAGDEEKDTKGIMIVNGYRLEELQGRNQAVFPANVVDHSTRNGNCLITTTQLLGLYFECQAHPERKEEMIQSLFDTVGVYQRFGEWQAFITHIQSTE